MSQRIFGSGTAAGAIIRFQIDWFQQLMNCNRHAISSSMVGAALASTIVALIPMSAYAQSVDTSSTAPWIVLGIDGKPYHDSLSSKSRSESGRNVLEWRISRAKVVAALATAIATSNLRSVEFDVWSKNNSLAAVQIDDVDKARFHAPVSLLGGKWKHVVLQPRDFKINDDSPVKKSAVQPEKLGNVLTFVELGSLLNAKDNRQQCLSGLYSAWQADGECNLRIFQWKVSG